MKKDLNSQKSKKNISTSSSTTTPKKRYPISYYLISLIAVPLLILAILEGILRIAGYGKIPDVFTVLSGKYPNTLYFNPERIGLYFPEISAPPTPVPDGFAAVKDSSVFRVFVLGESSAAGWPYVPNASFSRQLQRRLRLYYPDKVIEVVNLGVSAVNTFMIRDILPAVLEQKPDAVLIYTGHNEYYGTLGAASSQSFGGSSFFTRMNLAFKEIRIYQFIKNSISWFTGMFSSDSERIPSGQNETLMTRMAGENLIPFGSDLFEEGVEQFRSNLQEIVSACSDAGVPVLIGTLTSNIRDLTPFDGIVNKSSKAISTFQSAQAAELKERRKLFLQARDLDEIRFRAPSVFNDIIKELAKSHKAILVDIEALFREESPDGLEGDNLFVDHLHPNIEGYRMMGDAFYEKLKNNKLLPDGPIKLPERTADSVLSATFPMTALDSSLAKLKLMILKGGFPFTVKGSQNSAVKSFRPATLADSLAMKVIDRLILWEEAHYEMASYYFNAGNIEAGKREFDAIIEEKPDNDAAYNQLIMALITLGRYEEALPYLIRVHRISPTFDTHKWIGNIYVASGRYEESIPYLEGSILYKQNDSQIWYNLAGAYVATGSDQKAIDALNKCLQLEPNHPNARQLLVQVQKMLETDREMREKYGR